MELKDRFSHPAWRVLMALLIAALALMLRWRAVERIKIHNDEVDYLKTALAYSDALRAGDLQGVINYDYNNEHPSLNKLVYGAALLTLEESDENPEPGEGKKPPDAPMGDYYRAARRAAAVLGAAGVFVLALVNPLAGLLWAIFAWQINYTSQLMLEALPSLSSLGAVVCYSLSKRQHKGWLALSAACLGLTAASKYPYCAIGVAIGLDWLWETRPKQFNWSSLRRWLTPLAVWGALAVVVFFAANPRLWLHTAGRLKASLVYWFHFTASEHVQRFGYPFYQPLVWLLVEKPTPKSAFPVSIDRWITLAGFIGFPWLWKQRRVFAVWLALALVMLLVWTTKWPQYVLILTAPLCLSAAGLIEILFKTLLARIRPKKAPPAAI
jgi:hypothetical protein